MSNAGVYPPNLDTQVGQVRSMIPDLNATAIDTANSKAEYEMFSDLEIMGFIAGSGNSSLRSVGLAYLSLSGQAALQSKSVKDYDLQVDLTKRAADLRATAQLWFDQADDADAGVLEDAFEIVSMTGHCDPIPEATIPVWGRKYTRGRIC